ncbi:MAG: MATE family efflux transporter, partial [Gemmatimonadota bacterium]|nr:MATE family efflux transporter [Gemmatimonadota bacterium]
MTERDPEPPDSGPGDDAGAPSSGAGPAGTPPGATPPVGTPPSGPDPDAPKSPRQGFWSSVRESLSGTEQDFTRGSLNRGVFLLAIPMVLEMAGESLFVIVDAYFVGQLGASALAALALTETMLAVIYSLAVGLAMSTTALVARRVGEKDADGAAKSAV